MEEESCSPFLVKSTAGKQEGTKTHLRAHADDAGAPGGAPGEAAGRRELAAHQHDRGGRERGRSTQALPSQMRATLSLCARVLRVRGEACVCIAERGLLGPVLGNEDWGKSAREVRAIARTVGWSARRRFGEDGGERTGERRRAATSPSSGRQLVVGKQGKPQPFFPFLSSSSSSSSSSPHTHPRPRPLAQARAPAPAHQPPSPRTQNGPHPETRQRNPITHDTLSRPSLNARSGRARSHPGAHGASPMSV